MLCKLRTGSLLFVLFAAFGVPTTGPLAQEGTIVAVVDLHRLLRESLAGQTIESQMQQFRVSFGEQIAQKEAVLREKEQILIEQSTIVS